MIRRREFFGAVMSCVYVTSAMGIVGLVGGCGDSTETVAQPDKAKDQQIQDKMKEFMTTKKAPGSQKK